MPTDQNNGVNPNQNPINDNKATNINDDSGNQNIDLNLDGIELDNSGSMEDDTGALSADSLFGSGSSDTESSETKSSGDDRLLQEDKAVQESESAESSAQSEPVTENSESVEQVTKSVESAVEGVENEGVDLSELADVLPAQSGEEQSQPETSVQSAVEVSVPEMPSQSESVVQNNEVVQNDEPVDEGGVDLSGLADVLPAQSGEEQSQPETSVQSAVEVSVPEMPSQSESVVQNSEVVQNDEPVEEGGVDLSGLADVLPAQSGEEQSQSETSVQSAVEVSVPEMSSQSESVVQNSEVVQNDEPVEEGGVDLSGLADTLDTGGTDLDAPSDESVTLGQPHENTNEGIPADSLTVENIGVPVVEDSAGNMVSDTGDFSGKKDGYVPNESEFQKMSKLLDGSKPGQVEMPSDAMVGPTQAGENTVQDDNSKGVFNLDYVVSSLQDIERKHTMSSNTVVVNNSAVPSTIAGVSNSTIASSDMPVVDTPSTDNVVSVQPMMGQVENIQNNSTQGQGYVYQSNIPMNMPQPSVQPVETNNDAGNNVVQTPAPKIHHGPSALVIILVLICLLGAIGYILYKMYPDVVLGIFGKNNISIEYQNNTSSVILSGEDEDSGLTGDSLTGDVVEELTGDVLTGQVEQTNDDIQDDGTDDVMDPDTLTALLQLGDEDTDVESETTGENITEIHGGPSGDIDTYKDLGLLLDESNSDKSDVLKKLNDYKAQGIIYQDWGTENDNAGAYKYGAYIVKKSDAMIESIETTGEMDINEINRIFDTFDGYLLKLQALKSN